MGPCKGHGLQERGRPVVVMVTVKYAVVLKVRTRRRLKNYICRHKNLHWFEQQNYLKQELPTRMSRDLFKKHTFF